MYQKKSVYLLFVILLILSVTFVLAQEETTEAIDKAYACLKE